MKFLSKTFATCVLFAALNIFTHAAQAATLNFSYTALVTQSWYGGINAGDTVSGILTLYTNTPGTYEEYLGVSRHRYDFGASITVNTPIFETAALPATYEFYVQDRWEIDSGYDELSINFRGTPIYINGQYVSGLYEGVTFALRDNDRTAFLSEDMPTSFDLSQFEFRWFGFQRQDKNFNSLGHFHAELQSIEPQAEIPLPAAGWLLMSGIGALTAFGRKSRANPAAQER